MRGSLLLLLLLLPLYHAVAQPATEHNILIPANIMQPDMEMSSLCKWQNKIFIIPQYPEKHGNRIFYIDVGKVVNASAGHDTASVFAFSIFDLKKVKKYITDRGETYEGIEATAVDDEFNIYFSIETSADATNCYLVKGSIDGKKRGITLGKPQPLPRPKKIHNAGFESLAYMPDKKKLIAFYEYNRDTADALAYIIDPKTLKLEQTLKFDVPLYFRLTDITYLDKNRFAGINYYYKGDGKVYPDDNEHYEVAEKIIGEDPRKTCYASIIELSLRDNKVYYRPLKFVSNANDNWEGITTFGKGYIMVIDGKPPGKPCRLSWFPY